MEIDEMQKQLDLYKQKELNRKISIDKSKQRPDYKDKVKEYNKKYYNKKKELKNFIKES